MKNVVKCESLAGAVLCLQKVIDTGLESLKDLRSKGVTMKTFISMMDDYNSLVQILKECEEAGCDKFVILPVSDAQAEEYTDSDSIQKN